MKNKIIIGSVILLSVFILGGCNTVAGFGQDIQKGGQVVQRAATR